MLKITSGAGVFASGTVLWGVFKAVLAKTTSAPKFH